MINKLVGVNMKKYFLSLLLIVAIAAGVFCYIIDLKITAVIKSSAEDVVGMNLEMTGPFNYYGKTVANGALLGFEEINQEGGVNGVKIVPLIMDNRSDSVRAAFLANEFKQEGAVATIGPSISDGFIQTIPAAMQYKIPTVAATAAADEITVDRTGKPYDYVFRINFNTSFQANQMAKFALENLDAKRAIAVRKLNNVYSNGLTREFIESFGDGGGDIVDLINYSSNETDFTSYLNRIKDEDFDIIYMPGYDSEAANFIKQARELGITQPILGGDAYDTPTLFEIAGTSALNNVYYTTDFLRTSTDPKVQKFIASYKQKYGEEPFVDSARGYDSAYFIANAIKNAGSSNTEAIKNAMASMEDFQGVTGTFSMGKDHNPIKPIYIIGLEKGLPTQSVLIEPAK